MLTQFNWGYNSHTMKRFKKLIRHKLGYRIATGKDIDDFIEWFKRTVAPTAPTPVQSIAQGETYFTQHCIERPSPERLQRHINQAHAQFETEIFDRINTNMLGANYKLFNQWVVSDADVIVSGGPVYVVCWTSNKNYEH